MDCPWDVDLIEMYFRWDPQSKRNLVRPIAALRALTVRSRNTAAGFGADSSSNTWAGEIHSNLHGSATRGRCSCARTICGGPFLCQSRKSKRRDRMGKVVFTPPPEEFAGCSTNASSDATRSIFLFENILRVIINKI